MDVLCQEHIELIEVLLKNEVEFLIVGGYAVIFHGYVRSTSDMDLWLKPTENNKKKFSEALLEYGIFPKDVKKVLALNFDSINAFHIGKPPFRIDFLTKIAGLEYNETFQNCFYLPYKNFKIPVIQLQHLIINKLASGRAKDIADVEELQKINNPNKKK